MIFVILINFIISHYLCIKISHYPFYEFRCWQISSVGSRCKPPHGLAMRFSCVPYYVKLFDPPPPLLKCCVIQCLRPSEAPEQWRPGEQLGPPLGSTRGVRCLEWKPSERRRNRSGGTLEDDGRWKLRWRARSGGLVCIYITSTPNVSLRIYCLSTLLI